MNTCLTCDNSSPEAFDICPDCETLLWKSQLIAEIFATRCSAGSVGWNAWKAQLIVEVFTTLQQRQSLATIPNVGSRYSRGNASLGQS